MRARLLTIVCAAFFSGCDGEAPPVEPSGVFGCGGEPYITMESTPYVLPFPVGAAHTMDLGNCSTTFHAPERPDRYAYDFGMDIGSPITASRAGRVVHVEERGVDTEPRRAARSAGINNLVVVRHENGTFAQYMHLTHNGAEVEVGDLVERGDLIGRSGATGLAGYPHLHFIITRDGYDYPYVTVPVTFRNASPADLVLRARETYTALPY